MGTKLPENVALEVASQSAFTKAISTIQGLIKKGKITVAEDSSPIKKQLIQDRGAVHLSHVPHGFFEEEMKKFFSQFGYVTRLKLARSRKTGKSMGYAFIEFRHKEVAEIVAETMNNYLMFTKLIKAHYIPPEKCSDAIFLGRKFRPENCPGVANRIKNRKLSNRQLTSDQFSKRLKRSQNKLRKMQSRLDVHGVDYKIQLDGEAKLVVSNPDEAMKEVIVEIKQTQEKNRKRDMTHKAPQTKELLNDSITDRPNSESKRKRKSDAFTPRTSLNTKVQTAYKNIKAKEIAIESSVRDSPRTVFNITTSKESAAKKLSRRSLPDINLEKASTCTLKKLKKNTILNTSLKKSSPKMGDTKISIKKLGRKSMPCISVCSTDSTTRNIKKTTPRSSSKKAKM